MGEIDYGRLDAIESALGGRAAIDAAYRAGGVLLTTGPRGPAGADGAAGVAGATGPAGPGNRQAKRDSARGFGGQTWELHGSNAPSAITLANQRVLGTLAGFLAGDVVTNIVTYLSAAAVGTAPTDYRYALFGSDGTLLGNSANMASDAQLTAGGYVLAPLVTPVTISTDGGYYLCVWKNGTFSSSQPNYANSNNTPGSLSFNSKAIPSVSTGSAATTLPSSVTFFGSTSNIWFGWS